MGVKIINITVQLRNCRLDNLPENKNCLEFNFLPLIIFIQSAAEKPDGFSVPLFWQSCGVG